MDQNGDCQKVPSYYEDPNCKIFKDYSECLQCNDGYYLENLACTKNANYIENCLILSTNNTTNTNTSTSTVLTCSVC